MTNDMQYFYGTALSASIGQYFADCYQWILLTIKPHNRNQRCSKKSTNFWTFSICYEKTPSWIRIHRVKFLLEDLSHYFKYQLLILRPQ